MCAAVRFCFSKSLRQRDPEAPVTQRSSQSSALLLELPGLHKSPAATGKHPTVFYKLPQHHSDKNSFATIPRQPPGACAHPLWHSTCWPQKGARKGESEGNFLSAFCAAPCSNQGTQYLWVVFDPFSAWTYSWCFSLWHWVSKLNSPLQAEDISCYFQLRA